MFAGSIYEGTDDTVLVMMLLAGLATFAITAVGAVVAWAMTVSAVLQRRGWRPADRRVTAGMSCLAGLLILWAVLMLVPLFGSMMVAFVLVAAVPMAIWQRRVTRRCSPGV